MIKFVIFLSSFVAVSLSSPIFDDDNLHEFCKGKLYHAIAHPSESNKFIGCLHEQASVFSCRYENEIFDAETTSCVLQNESNKDNENPCAGFISGNVAIPNNCTFYYYCEFERAFPRECSEGEIFDLTNLNCIEGSLDECLAGLTTTTEFVTNETTESNEISTTPTEYESETTEEIQTQTSEETTEQQTSTTTEYKTTTQNDIIVTFTCPSSGYGNIPNSLNCERYYECIAGIRYLRTCENNQLFDAITLQCTSPDLALCANLIKCG